MLTVYADETGHPRGKDFLVVGGLLSSADRWEQLEAEWNQAKTDYGFPVDQRGEFVPFHATDFFCGCGDFKGYAISEHDKRELYKRFLLTMVENVESSAFSIVLNDVWKRYVQGDAEKMTKVYSMCAIGLASRFVHWSRKRDAGQINYVFEKATGCHQGPALDAIQNLAIEHGNNYGIGSVSAARKGLAPLDAADIWCYELWCYLKNQAATGSNDPRPSMVALMHIQQQCGFIFDDHGVRLFIDHITKHQGMGTTEAPMQAVPVPFRIAP